MRAKLGYILAAGVAFTIGVTARWFARVIRLHPSPDVVTTKPAPTPQAARSRPERRPEYFGVVERVELSTLPTGKVVAKFLIRGQRPPLGISEPTSPLFFFDGQADRLWVNIVDTPVERRGGPIGVGELLSVWHRGEVIEIDPGQVYPEYVVSDPAPRE